MPSQPLEAANSSHPDLDPFSTEQLAFCLQVATISAERPARRNHSMTGDARVAAVPHDIADGT